MPKANHKKQETNYQFKILYAIGIILVLIYHLGNKSTLKILDDWFAYNPFVLALFIFCSGYFYKKGNETHWVRYIIRKIKRLIVPLLLWNFFYAGIVLLLSTKNFTIGHEVTIENLFLTPFRTGHQFTYNLGSWFIAPLFVIELLNLIARITIVKRLKPQLKDIVMIIFSLLLGVFSIHLASLGLTHGWLLLIARTCFLFPFFEIGIIYKNHLEEKDNLPNILYFCIIFISALIVNTVCGRVPSYIVSSMANFNNGALLPYLSALIPLAFWLRISKLLTPLIGKSKAINTIADNTYSIMVNHLLGFMIVKSAFAIISKIITITPDFNWVKYKSDIWYYYYPFGNKNFSIIYLIVGLIVPIIMQKIVHHIFILIKSKVAK